MQRILPASRYLILIAILGSFVAATVLILYGGYNTIRLVIEAFSFLGRDPDEIKNVAVNFIGIVDVFLLGTIFYIIALGLYELFIDDQVKVPCLVGNSFTGRPQRKVDWGSYHRAGGVLPGKGGDLEG